MTLRLWEVAVAAVMLALVVLFFVSGDPEGGFVLLALVLLGAASRARIIERPIAGSYACTRGLIGMFVTGTLFAVYVVVVILFAIAAINHWMRSDRGHGRTLMSLIVETATKRFSLRAREISIVGPSSGRVSFIGETRKGRPAKMRAFLVRRA
jgi:hypothetical protein